jgi:hypothetical protein
MTIEAEVRQYVAKAMADRFDDGSFAAYDATLLHVISPEPLSGREIRIFHDAPVPEGSPWRQAPGTVRFDVDEGLLHDGTRLFAGAVRSLQAVPAR